MHEKPLGAVGRDGYFFSTEERRDVWPIDRERVLILGRAYRLLLEVSHPKTSKLINENARFTFDRLQRTMLGNTEIIFGTTEQALSRAKIVNFAHKAASKDPSGIQYSANSPELMAFVFRMRIKGALDTFENFVHPLGTEDKDRYVLGIRKYGQVLGVPQREMPISYKDLLSGYLKSIEQEEIKITKDARQIAQKVTSPFKDFQETIEFFVRGSIPNKLVEKIAQEAFGRVKPLANNLNLLVTKGLMSPDLRKMYGFDWPEQEAKLFEKLSAFIRGLVKLSPKRIRLVPEFYNYLSTQG